MKVILFKRWLHPLFQPLLGNPRTLLYESKTSLIGRLCPHNPTLIRVSASGLCGLILCVVLGSASCLHFWQYSLSKQIISYTSECSLALDDKVFIFSSKCIPRYYTWYNAYYRLAKEIPWLMDGTCKSCLLLEIMPKSNHPPRALFTHGES